MKYEKEHKESRNWFMAWVVIIFLLACCVVQSGCANTCRGFGMMVQGAGQMVSGVGTDTVEAVDAQTGRKVSYVRE